MTMTSITTVSYTHLYYDSFSFREPTAFLIGNEGNGLTKEISDQSGQYLKIPMEGKVESRTEKLS